MSARELFRVERLPVLQNRVYATVEEAMASPTGDVVLRQDLATGLVFNSAFDPALLVYDDQYQNEQALSPVFRRHLQEVIGIVNRHLAGRSLIEVGCGKGTFLEMLRAADYAATGIDPAYEGDSPHVIRAPFEASLGLSADGIVLRHVLEHMQDPVSFLQAIAEANDRRGLIYIEVPCFDWICAHRAWFDIFYEHVNYFRLGDLHRMFGRVVESGHVFGGQYLYAVADVGTLRVPAATPADAVAFPPDFMDGIARSRAAAALAKGARLAIWGASSKGVIFAEHMEQAGVRFDLAIDMNPAKQERHMASTALKIVSPEQALRRLEPGSLVFVMNSNYYDEIVAQSGNAFRYLKVDQHEL
jgi:SAM-dependent methyltransferase